jgi:hypothetical protein
MRSFITIVCLIALPIILYSQDLDQNKLKLDAVKFNFSRSTIQSNLLLHNEIEPLIKENASIFKARYYNRVGQYNTGESAGINLALSLSKKSLKSKTKTYFNFAMSYNTYDFGFRQYTLYESNVFDSLAFGNNWLLVDSMISEQFRYSHYHERFLIGFCIHKEFKMGSNFYLGIGARINAGLLLDSRVSVMYLKKLQLATHLQHYFYLDGSKAYKSAFDIIALDYQVEQFMLKQGGSSGLSLPIMLNWKFDFIEQLVGIDVGFEPGLDFVFYPVTRVLISPELRYIIGVAYYFF